MRRARAGLLVAVMTGALGVADTRAGQDLTRWVDPFIGTGGHGHTYPGPTLPFGMIQPGPDTRLTGWDGCSGYHYSDSTVYGFSHTHLSGTGVADYCDVLFLPATGPVKRRTNYENPARDGYGSRFRKQTERAEAGYYRVTLDDYGVDVELTATPRTAWHRYTFKKNDAAHVLIDLTHRDELLDAHIRVVDARRIEGLRRSRSWAKDQRVYFAAEFDRDFRAEITDSIAVLHFDVRRGGKVHAKVALSSVSEEGAWKNLRAEAPGWNFDATRKRARTAWNAALGKIVVEGGTEEQRTIFYTALYHTMLQPNLFEDVDGRFRGMDGEVHDSPGYTRYSVFSLWDTFRAAHPLYTIIERERTLDFIRTFLAMYREGGRLPVWELWGNETDCMIGYHSVSVITDAFHKGIRDFDTSLALEAMVAAADGDRLGLDSYRQHGYIPADRESESVSKTLEYAYDDWCIAQFAPGVAGTSDTVRRFVQRAHSWQHLVDEDGFMRPRANGRWLDPFDPREVTFHYTEANAWQYRFFVPHDIDGLNRAVERGGTAFTTELDAMFSMESETTGRTQADITGLIGQYAHGNEPSHHIAYLYTAVGQYARTEALVRRIMTEMYRAAPDGLIGNEDCGQMSAWYVFSALGFYPLTPGLPRYVPGSPVFPRATLHLENGKEFAIVASGTSDTARHVRTATWIAPDGTRRADAFDRIEHDALLRGGSLVLEMSEEPGRKRVVGFLKDVVIGIRYSLQAPIVEGPAVFADTARVHLRAYETASWSAIDSIYFTTDGHDPDRTSMRYTGPFVIDTSTTLRVRAIQGGTHSPIVDATFRKLDPNVKITVRNPVHRQYQAGGDLALIDGIRGGEDFRLGTWQGIYGVDLDVDVDLGASRPIRRLATGFLHDQNSWIFFPLEVVYSVSEDGVTWREAGRVSSTLDPRHDGAVVEDFAVELAAPVPARYVRVLARSPIMCPDWHKGAGNRAFIFADEVIVE